MGINRVLSVKEIERRHWVGQRQITLPERTHGTDVLPVTVKNIGYHALRGEQAGNHFLTEISLGMVRQGLTHHLAREHINAHGGQAVVAVRLIRKTGTRSAA